MVVLLSPWPSGRTVRLNCWLLLALLTGRVQALLAQAPTAKPLNLERILRAGQGRQRLLLLLATTADQPDFQRQRAQLADQLAGLAERDFRVVEVLYDQLGPGDRRFLVRKLGGPLPAFAAGLIGKDGGVKLRQTRPVTPQELFGLVDQMPMRRQEMRRPPRRP